MIKNCLQCNKPQDIPSYREATFRFCSHKCRGQAMKGHVPWNKGIRYTPEEKGKLNMTGLKIGLGYFKGTRGILKANKGSFKKGHSLNKGIKSYLWKGGVTPVNKLIRRSTEFRLWREAVFKRDDWICQDCKERGGELHPHHIKPFAIFPELRFAIDNGLTLCKKCHMKTDSWGRNIPSLKSESLNN